MTEVTNLNDDGEGSLRDIMTKVNATPVPTLPPAGGIGFPNPFLFITFAVSGIIKLENDLPAMTRSHVYIIGDGKIEIDCNCNVGLTLKAEICSIKGISITNSINYGIGIFADYCSVFGCRIGVDFSDNVKPNIYGIMIKKCNNAFIGDNAELDQSFYSNVISGNTQEGIAVIESCKNTIINNIIGLDSTGSFAIPNWKSGICFELSDNNTIGGIEFVDKEGNVNNPTGVNQSAPVFVRPLFGNLISGNKECGIRLYGCGWNNLNGNFIGIDKTGTKAIANEHGVYIDVSVYTNLTGCKIFNNPFVYYNVISGNTKSGITVYNSKLTTIQGNFVGISATNDSAVPNENGLVVSGDSSIVTFGGRVPLGNVVSGNKKNGILLKNKTSKVLSFNTFCGISAFGGAIPNGENGYLLIDETNDHDLRTNVISGNNGNGIEIKDEVKNVQIVCNIIGLDTLGQVAVPNGGDGINVSGNASDIQIINDTVPSIILRNTVSGNLGHGIVFGGESNNCTVTGSTIGLDMASTLPVYNGKNGIVIEKSSHNNTIGSLESRNYIVGADTAAVLVYGNDNEITENSINTNALFKPVSVGEPYSDLSTDGCNKYYSNDIN